MKAYALCFSLLLFSLSSFSQQHLNLNAIIEPEIAPGKTVAQALFNDSLVTSSIIYISKEVKLHKHISHSEHVLVLEGEGEMQMGDKTFRIKKDDFIFIPKGVPHAVKTVSSVPLKVISIQAPMFDGKDRVMLE